MTLAESEIERILTAAETIEESLGILVDYQSLGQGEYRTDRTARDVVERRFVKTTEAALDIAKTIVAHETGTHPESNPTAMQSLANVGILDEKTAESMAQTARFRNVLAHTYGDIIDHDVVYSALHSDGCKSLPEQPRTAVRLLRQTVTTDTIRIWSDTGISSSRSGTIWTRSVLWTTSPA